MKCQGPGEWGPGGGCVGGHEKGVLVWRTEYRPTLGGSRAPAVGKLAPPSVDGRGDSTSPHGCWGPPRDAGPRTHMLQLTASMMRAHDGRVGFLAGPWAPGKSRLTPAPASPFPPPSPFWPLRSPHLLLPL